METEAYAGFAEVYDQFMDNVPYAEWCGYVCEQLTEYNINDGLILELGCGTGTFTELLASRGYDMIGVDNAEDMLAIAMEKKAASGHEILYLLQDMREFELYGTVRAVVSVCDCMNYVTDPAELLSVFKLVWNYLDWDGLFIFDMNTVYKYRELLGDNVFAENRENCSFIWENVFDEQEMLNEYGMTFFIKEGSCYQKYEEEHYQRAYELNQVIELLEKAGLSFVKACDAMTHQPLSSDSERQVIIARKEHK